VRFELGGLSWGEFNLISAPFLQVYFSIYVIITCAIFTYFLPILLNLVHTRNIQFLAVFFSQLSC